MIGVARKGHISGQPSLGYTKNGKDKTIVIDEVEAETVRKIFRLYLDGMPVCAICKLFNEEKVLNKHCGITTMDKTLPNKIYSGNIVHGKKGSKKSSSIRRCFFYHYK